MLHHVHTYKLSLIQNIYVSCFPRCSQMFMLVSDKVNQAVMIPFSRCLVQTLAGTLVILIEVFPGVT
jgi:hypothetical protein